MKVVTYYVNSSTGCDRNPGTSPEQPFKTLSAVNALTLEPGDRVLLARGCVFENQHLHLRARGTKEAPVTVESYGEGALPHIKASGTGLWYQNYGQPLDNPNHVWHGYVSSAVLLYDREYIRLRDLEISNDPGLLPGERYNQGDKMNRTGVAVVAQNRGTLHGITLTGLHVYDVKGNVYDKHLANGGIYYVCQKPERENGEIARYEDLHITHCRVERCSRWGIAAGYSYPHEHFTGLYLPDETVKTYGRTGVLIEDCFLRDMGGDGITPHVLLQAPGPAERVRKHRHGDQRPGLHRGRPPAGEDRRGHVALEVQGCSVSVQRSLPYLPQPGRPGLGRGFR